MVIKVTGSTLKEDYLDINDHDQPSFLHRKGCYGPWSEKMWFSFRGWIDQAVRCRTGEPQGTFTASGSPSGTRQGNRGS